MYLYTNIDNSIGQIKNRNPDLWSYKDVAKAKFNTFRCTTAIRVELQVSWAFCFNIAKDIVVSGLNGFG